MLNSYSDLFNNEWVEYVSNFRSYIRFKCFHRLHTSREINKIFNIPLKRIWNSRYCKAKFNSDKPICFIFFSNWVSFNEEIHLTDYLRRHYPNCRLVWFLQDMFDKQRKLYSGDKLDYDIVCKQFDLIISFDKSDCEKYGFIYHPLVFSTYHGEIKEMPQTDIYFLAKAKDRLPEILATYEVLRESGLLIDFYLTGVKEEDQKYKDEIHYIQSIPYEENIQHILHTKCLLEIMQRGSTGYTQRGVEAVCFGKKLLTNNTRINEEPFYRKEYISMFDAPENIDRCFLSEIPIIENIDYQYKHKMSPVELLEFIETRI